VIEIRDLVMRQPSGGAQITILDRVTLDVPTGQFLAVTGPSGSGKSTLLGLIAGLDQPTSGSIRVAGHDVTSLNEDALAKLRRQTIGYVFQSFHLIPTLTALENVAVPLELAAVPDALIRARALLSEIGLADRVGHYPAQLSGGEQQRVAIARAFINQPKILFADEPTGNLDAETAQGIVKLIFDLNADLGTTLILVTHDRELTQQAGRVIRLRGGKLVADNRSFITAATGS
jgi:putative ABC transport system ATP-binding protein